MKKIKVFNKIADKGLSKFPVSQYEQGSSLEQADAIILRSHKLKEAEIDNSVVAIGRAGAGVNNIPIDYASQKGIVVFNTPGANANAVKELVLAAMLTRSRNLFKAAMYTHNLVASEDMHKDVEDKKKQFKGSELYGKRLGVVGLGAIGLMVANAAVALGMQVTGYDPYLSVDRAWELSSDVKPAVGLESMLREVDFVSVHMPFTSDTASFINETRLSYMKKGSTLLNFSREEIVDHQALVRALDAQHISAYVSDFPSETLLGRDDVIFYPHLGASTQEAEDNCAVMIVDQVRRFIETGNITHSVNFPHCNVPLKPDAKRLTIINKNIPALISQITTVLADQGINIIELTNKSKSELAYNLIDYQGELQSDFITQLSEINGVISVRHIT